MKKNVLKKNALLGALTSKDTATTNGAVSHSTTGTSLLDFFSRGAALRNSDEKSVTSLFSSAYSEDKSLALKTLFYLSDVRQGQGERRLFRLCFNWLAKNDEKVAKKMLKHIGEFTRFDNILESTENTPVESDSLEFVAKLLRADMKASEPSLLAKWLPSEQASSETTRRLAKKVREQLKMSPKVYRKTLSRLRSALDIVERNMATGNWKKIDFSAVPSRASLLYKNAFNKHEPKRYSSFLTKVEKGEAKINASVLYPYDLTRGIGSKDSTALRTIEAQWKSLPDYCDGENMLVVADVSGSMGAFGHSYGNNVSPIDVSVSLALYIAERNSGPFNGYFLTFDSDSRLVKVTGNSLKDKMTNIAASPWGGSTNLQSAFDNILRAALRDGVPQKDMPKKVLVISDMQFNVACQDNSKTNLEVIRGKYEKAGYQMPQLVFWNVNGGSDSPAKFNESGIALISGASPSALKSALSGKIVSPWDTFLSTVNSERYSEIKA